MSRKNTLYLSIVDGKFYRCTREGIINWVNTREYSIEQLDIELNIRKVRLLPHSGDENKNNGEPEWFGKLLKGL